MGTDALSFTTHHLIVRSVAEAKVSLEENRHIITHGHIVAQEGPIQKRDRTLDTKGLILLQQLVLARAFPRLLPRQRIACIPKLFDSNITLNRLCLISGGHVRTLLGLLYNCLQQNDPPFNRDCIEAVIKGYRDDILLAVEDNEWKMLAQVMQQQTIRGEQEYQILLRSLFVYEYQDQQGRWFGINPALAETTRFKQMLRSLG